MEASHLPNAASGCWSPVSSAPLPRSPLSIIHHSSPVLQRGLEWEGGRAGGVPGRLRPVVLPALSTEDGALLMDLYGSQSISKDYSQDKGSVCS